MKKTIAATSVHSSNFLIKVGRMNTSDSE